MTERRPLVGEPLSLDLVNTQWVDRGRTYDLFDDLDGVSTWLQEHLLHDPGLTCHAPLRHTRAALRAVLETPGEESEAALNDVLARGRVRFALHAHAPTREDEAPPAWLTAFHAAMDYLDLLRTRPDRIRRCANPTCVLYFHDTSRNGTRRWCSMAGCGSRTKAKRHYRNRQPGPSGVSAGTAH